MSACEGEMRSLHFEEKGLIAQEPDSLQDYQEAEDVLWKAFAS